jgi:hypothetical protein
MDEREGRTMTDELEKPAAAAQAALDRLTALLREQAATPPAAATEPTAADGQDAQARMAAARCALEARAAEARRYASLLAASAEAGMAVQEVLQTARALVLMAQTTAKQEAQRAGVVQQVEQEKARLLLSSIKDLTRERELLLCFDLAAIEQHYRDRVESISRSAQEGEQKRRESVADAVLDKPGAAFQAGMLGCAAGAMDAALAQAKADLQRILDGRARLGR